MCIGGGDPHTCTHRDTYMYVAPGHRRVDSLNSKYKYRKEKKKQMQKKKKLKHKLRTEHTVIRTYAKT